MKNVFVVLPGSSKYNKAWVDEWEEYFKSLDHECIFVGINWPHWDGIAFDMNREVDDIYSQVKNYVASDKYQVTILAKSMGTRVLNQLFYKIDSDHFKKIIYMGIPYKSLETHGDISEMYEPLLDLDYDFAQILQEDKDPLGSYSKISSFLKEYDIEASKIEGSSHQYDIDKVVDKVEFIE